MLGPTITRMHVRGLRTLADVSLDLRGLTVVTGDNGCGKSTLVEACEIARRAAEPQFLPKIAEIHGWPYLLARGGASSQTAITIDVGEVNAQTFRYRLEWAEHDVVREVIGLATEDSAELGLRIHRDNADSRGPFAEPGQPLADGATWATGAVPADHYDTAVSAQLGRHPQQGLAASRCALALRDIAVHPGFDTTARWATRKANRESAMRTPPQLRPAADLEHMGANLACLWHAIKANTPGAKYAEHMWRVSELLGCDVEDVRVPSQAGGGYVAIEVAFRGQAPVTQAALSDGQLALLCYLGMLLAPTRRSLLVLDEPDLHLHPRALYHLVHLLVELASRHPVLVTTHSDRMLDLLSAPADQVVVAELDRATRSTRLLRPQREVLAQWIDTFRGYGGLRAAGLEPRVLPEP